MKYKAVLFDMDGTILDTIDDLRDAVNHTLTAHGYPCCDTQTVRDATGNGAKELIAGCLPQGAETPDFDTILHEYKTYYAAHTCVKTAPYEGIVALLDELQAKGCKVAIVSNKPDGAVKPLAEKFFPGIPAFGEAGLPRKPAPDMVYHALKILGVEKESAAYVGDSEVDVATAKNAGMDLIAVSWGFRSRARLKESGAVNIADDIAQLREKVL